MRGPNFSKIEIEDTIHLQHTLCQMLVGAARASQCNISFLEDPRTALVSSVDFHSGIYPNPARKHARLQEYMRWGR